MDGPHYPSHIEQAANADLFCYGCRTQAVYCPQCWDEGAEATACKCSSLTCENGHNCSETHATVNALA